MSSVNKRTALLVGSSGLLGPVWFSTLQTLGFDILTADFTDPNCTHHIDLANSESISQLLKDLPDGIDCVILNSGRDSKPVLADSHSGGFEFKRDDWSNFFETNVVGPAQLIEGLVPKLADGAKVIAVGSMYALVSPRQDVYNSNSGDSYFLKHPAYGASKAALLNLMNSYATRFAGKFNFNVLTLGVVDANQPTHFKETMPRNIPTGRFLDRHQLGSHLAYLLNAPSGQLIASNLIVDGGYTAW